MLQAERQTNPKRAERIGSFRKSVGEFRLRYSAKRRVHSNFSAMQGPKPERFSGGRFCFGIETLDHAAGELPFDTELVERQRGRPSASLAAWTSNSGTAPLPT